MKKETFLKLKLHRLSLLLYLKFYANFRIHQFL